MADYVRKTWVNGEVITDVGLNNLEQGIGESFTAAKTAETKAEDAKKEVEKKAPKNHAASSPDYGKGDGTNYGHVKLSDDVNSTSDKDGGVAASPKAVKEAYDLAESAGNAAAKKVAKAGDTMTGKLIAQNNTSYAEKQVRNIFLIADGETLPDGSNGDICLVYTP